MAGGQLEVFDQAGYFPHRSDPTRFVTVLAWFAAQNPPAALEAERWRSALRLGN